MILTRNFNGSVYQILRHRVLWEIVIEVFGVAGVGPGQGQLASSIE